MQEKAIPVQPNEEWQVECTLKEKNWLGLYLSICICLIQWEDCASMWYRMELPYHRMAGNRPGSRYIRFAQSRSVLFIPGILHIKN